MLTQIGSLPFADVDDAVQYSCCYPIPFLPELSVLGDSMLEYIKTPGQLSCLKEFKKHEFEKVKIQCVGPATLIMAGYKEADAIERIYNHVSVIMKGLQAEQIILFLDEPGVGQIGFEVDDMWNAIFSAFDVVPGVHVCGNANWDKIFASNIDIISFDASQFDITIFPKYRNNKHIAWGINNVSDIRDFQEGDFITSPCGMSPQQYSIEDCENILEKLKLISQELC